MMFEEQIQNYKSLEPWKRCLFMVALGAILPAFIFYDEGADIETRLSEVDTKTTTARDAFQGASNKKEKIAELSENLETTKHQLELATKLLPDAFLMDEILQAAAETAADLGLIIDKFAPGEPIKPVADVKYEEMPIEVSVNGNFNKVAVFYDRLVHLDKLVHIRSLSVDGPSKFDTKSVEGWSLLTPLQRAKKAGERARVVSNATIIVFRGLK